MTSPKNPKGRDIKVALDGYRKALEAAPDSDLATRKRGGLKAIVEMLEKRAQKEKEKAPGDGSGE